MFGVKDGRGEGGIDVQNAEVKTYEATEAIPANTFIELLGGAEGAEQYQAVRNVGTYSTDGAIFAEYVDNNTIIEFMNGWVNLIDITSTPTIISSLHISTVGMGKLVKMSNGYFIAYLDTTKSTSYAKLKGALLTVSGTEITVALTYEPSPSYTFDQYTDFGITTLSSSDVCVTVRDRDTDYQPADYWWLSISSTEITQVAPYLTRQLSRYSVFLPAQVVRYNNAFRCFDGFSDFNYITFSNKEITVTSSYDNVYAGGDNIASYVSDLSAGTNFVNVGPYVAYTGRVSQTPQVFCGVIAPLSSGTTAGYRKDMGELTHSYAYAASDKYIVATDGNIAKFIDTQTREAIDVRYYTGYTIPNSSRTARGSCGAAINALSAYFCAYDKANLKEIRTVFRFKEKIKPAETKIDGLTKTDCNLEGEAWT